MKKETGVQEFARRLNLETQEAERVYELIKQHQMAVINVAKLSDKLNHFAMEYNNQSCIEELTYLKNHFVSDLGESWKKRIEVLRGGPDEYIEKLLEEQRMRDEIEELHQQLNEKDSIIKNMNDNLHTCMNNQNSKSNARVGVFGLVGVGFIMLKLTGYIDWSWWWVTVPLWGGIAIESFFALVFVIVTAVIIRRNN